MRLRVCPGFVFSALATLATLVAAPACSSSTGSAPEWLDAPKSIRLGQGETATLALTLRDADGDAVKVTLRGPGFDGGASPDGKSLAVHAGYDAEAKTEIVVVLDDARGHAREVHVPVEVEAIKWHEPTSWTAEGPAAREHGTMLLDDEKRAAYLVGGSGYKPQGTTLGDVWKLDLATHAWSPVTPTGDVPPPGGSRRAALIPGTKTALLFGGYETSESDTADLFKVDWSGDVLAFQKIEQPAAPPGRELHAFVYDAQSQRFAAFGGFSSAKRGAVDDTWTMKLEGNRAVWTEVKSADKPSARYGFFYGLDDATGRLVVFSGAQNPKGKDPINAAKDTWVLDLRAESPTWARVLTGEEESSPPGRRNGCSLFDPRGPRLVVYGGTSDGAKTQPGLFVLDVRPGHEAWKQLDLAGAPPLRSSGFGFYDPTTRMTYCGFGNDDRLYTDLTALGY
jgi:Galactose oxidase, central domain